MQSFFFSRNLKIFPKIKVAWMIRIKSCKIYPSQCHLLNNNSIIFDSNNGIPKIDEIITNKFSAFTGNFFFIICILLWWFFVSKNWPIRNIKNHDSYIITPRDAYYFSPIAYHIIINEMPFDGLNSPEIFCLLIDSRCKI